MITNIELVLSIYTVPVKSNFTLYICYLLLVASEEVSASCLLVNY